MHSRILTVLAVASVLGLFAAMMGVKAHRAWLPVTVDFGCQSTLSGPSHVPLAWPDELWLRRDPLEMGQNSSWSERTWKTIRNWNRAPLVVVRAQGNYAKVASSNLPDGTFALMRSRSNKPKIEIWRDGRLRRTLVEKPHRNRWDVMEPAEATLLSLSPDGTRLVADSRLAGLSDYYETQWGFCTYGLALFDVTKGCQIVRHSAVEGCFSDFAWSPDGHELAGITVDGWVFVVNARTGQKRLKFRAHQLFGAQIVWAPDGKTLITATNPRLAWSPSHLSFDFKSGAGVTVADFGGTTTIGSGPTKLVIRTDANGDATINERAERLLKRFDASTGKAVGAPLPVQFGAVDLAFSPDGKQLALGEHGFALLLNAQTLKTERRLTIPAALVGSSPSNSPVCVAWAPDGATLATSTWHGLTLWRIQ